jgi:DNA-binding transcriptional LysR family regulator
MNLREIECFIAVADELHFGRAAHRLHLAQPTVSESVRRLERHIGGPLFDRSTRNVRLTELGTAFLTEARAAYQRVETAYETGRLLARRQELQFTVGACTGDENLLVRAIAALARRRPTLNVEFEEISTLAQLDALRQRRIDAGIAWVPPEQDDIASMVLGSTPYAAVVQQSSPLARRGVLSLRQLAAEPLITWSRMMNPLLYERFATAMDALGVPWSLVATANGVTNLMSRVVSGQGVGLIPASAVIDRRLPGIAVVPLDDDGPSVERVLIWPRQAPHLVVPTFANILRRIWATHDEGTGDTRQFG